MYVSQVRSMERPYKMIFCVPMLALARVTTLVYSIFMFILCLLALARVTTRAYSSPARLLPAEIRRAC